MYEKNQDFLYQAPNTVTVDLIVDKTNWVNYVGIDNLTVSRRKAISSIETHRLFGLLRKFNKNRSRFWSIDPSSRFLVVMQLDRLIIKEHRLKFLTYIFVTTKSINDKKSH
ncbi:hypothetical protein BpHYR1_019617 [Brachionus plicatilis]|uniref:Uncharacterized protein n=1 Tax=Brachionus plicatilis TaxID=10195 RepID=A0A3M7QSI3_BRAPC|nr:hypothetical protein BpHYR1_019617 [Brachionus plicatilis]